MDFQESPGECRRLNMYGSVFRLFVPFVKDPSVLTREVSSAYEFKDSTGL